MTQEKINIAELLKDCPKDMELDCTCADNVVFDKIIEYDQIKCVIGESRDPLILDKYGRLLHICCPKCVIFPKGKTTWTGFQMSFKDGDIVATERGNWIGITTGGKKRCFMQTYCIIKDGGEFEVYFNKKGSYVFSRLATEKEKQKLFDAIKENGYKWNPETKTLEKLVEPKFKVGNRVKYKNGKNIDGVEQGVILSITNNTYDIAVTNNMGIVVPIADQDKWELIPNKFDINTLVPFESRVLVRDSDGEEWRGSFWGHLKQRKEYKYDTIRGVYKQCIPYNDDTKHLLGKTHDCSEYYKTWK